MGDYDIWYVLVLNAIIWLFAFVWFIHDIDFVSRGLARTCEKLYEIDGTLLYIQRELKENK